MTTRRSDIMIYTKNLSKTYGNGENLAQWMKSEVYSWSSFQTDGVAQAIINRLAQHGIN